MTLQDLLVEQFKVKTRLIINPLTASVGTSVVQILGNNPNRLAWLIVNLSSNALYLGFDRDVSSSKCILVSVSGGSVGFIWNEDFELVGYEIFAKASGASSAVYVVEVVTAE